MLLFFVLPQLQLLLLLLLVGLEPTSLESGDEIRTLTLAGEDRVGVRLPTTVRAEDDEDDDEDEGKLLLRFFLSLSLFFLLYTELPNFSETIRILPMGEVLTRTPLLLVSLFVSLLIEPTTGIGSEEGVSTRSMESMVGRLRW